MNMHRNVSAYILINFADFEISTISGKVTQSSTTTALSTNANDDLTTPSTSISTQTNDEHNSTSQSTDDKTLISCENVSAMRCARDCYVTRGCSSFSVHNEFYQMQKISDNRVEFKLV